MSSWKFERKLRSQKARDPVQDSFFTNESIEDDTHALVREAIQNSLDAKIDNSSNEPVIANFVIGEHSSDSSVMNDYISEEAWKHFNAPGNGLTNPPRKGDPCRFLVYEDFNTTGLIGNKNASEPEAGNSFYYFMRAEGQSGKEEGDRGRHGLGKYVFPKTSGIRMFLMATVRSDDQRCLIAGQSVLKSHTVDGNRYTPDGWWGEYDEDGEDSFQLPVENPSLFQKIKEDFCLSRTTKDSGVSLVMPYVDSSIDLEKIANYVIAEYFYPILNNQLIVKLTVNCEEKIIDGDSLRSNLDDFLSEDKASYLTPYIHLAIRALDEEDLNVIDLPLSDTPSMPAWTKDYLNKEIAESIDKEMEKKEGLVCINAPLYVQLADSNDAHPSFFSIYMMRDSSDSSSRPLFVREGITIPEDKVQTVRGFTCIVVINEGPLASLLGDSENPAHTEWEKNASKFKNKYRWGAKTIDFVRGSVSKLIKLLSQADEEEDRNVLADIFYIDLPENDDEVPESRKQRKKNKKDNEGEPEIVVEPPPPQPRYYKLSQINDGFKISGPNTEINKPRVYRLKVAYDIAGASKAKALKKYHRNDFDLGSNKTKDFIEASNVKGLKASGQNIIFAAVSNDFELKVTGFDERRDVIVDVKSEEYSDEAV